MFVSENSNLHEEEGKPVDMSVVVCVSVCVCVCVYVCALRQGRGVSDRDQ